MNTKEGVFQRLLAFLKKKALSFKKNANIVRELVKKNIPDGTKALLFLEEEIRSGGAGMNLCDKLADFLDARKISHAILAIDDSFVASTEKGRSIYESAGIDAESIFKRIKSIL